MKFFWYEVILSTQVVAISSNFVKFNFDLFWQWNSSCQRAEIFTRDPLPVLFQNEVVNDFSNWILTFFDQCARSKMLNLPFIMIETWYFYQRPLACSFSKHSGNFFSNWILTFFDHTEHLSWTYSIVRPRIIVYCVNSYF